MRDASLAPPLAAVYGQHDSGNLIGARQVDHGVADVVELPPTLEQRPARSSLVELGRRIRVVCVPKELLERLKVLTPRGGQRTTR